MEEIPGSVTETEEFFLLLSLCFRAVTAGSKRTSTGGAGSVAEWRAASFVLSTGSSLVVAIGCSTRRRGSGRLVASIVNKLRQQFGAAPGNFLLSFLRRLVSS